LKYLPHITLCLWLMLIVGYLQQRDFILQPLVKFPSVILLSVFLTVSFWILQKARKPGFSLLFIGILIFNIWMPFYASIINNQYIKTVERDSEKGIDPKFAELLISGETVEERQMAAQIIYTRHGVVLAYKGTSDSFTLHTPTKIDKDQYIIANEQRMQAEKTISNLNDQIEASNFLVALQLALFFVLLIFLLLYDRPKAGAEEELPGKASGLGIIRRGDSRS